MDRRREGVTLRPQTGIERKGAVMLVRASVEYDVDDPPDAILIRGERYVRDTGKRKNMLNL